MDYKDLQTPDKIVFGINNIDNNDLKFRIEIEMAKCTNINNANKFIDFAKNYYIFQLCKNDRPVQDIGLNLFSNFFTFDEFKNNSDCILDILKNATSAGFKAHDAKNLYFRVILWSKNPFDKITKRKIDLFVHGHSDFLKKFSRRTNTNKIKYNSDKSYQQFGNDIIDKKLPVNFLNDNEIAFNIFRSTMNFQTILASIELCHIIFNFCKNEINVDNILLNNGQIQNMFNEYMMANSHYIHPYLESKNIKLEKQCTYLTENTRRQRNDSIDLVDYITQDQNSNDLWNISKYTEMCCVKPKNNIIDDLINLYNG